MGKTTTISSAAPTSRRLLLPICYLGFVSLGLPDTLIGVAWPSIREHFALQQSHISWIFFGSGCSYFLSSFFAGRLLKIFNVGVLLAVSSGLVALSAVNYSFATIWPWFALGALLHGLGSGAIDSGLNHYVASHFSARHMNWLHASYSLGAMLGPILMTACLARPNGWRLGYLIVAITLFILALLFLSTKSQWDGVNQNKASGQNSIESAAKSPEPNASSPSPLRGERAGVRPDLAETLHEPPNFPHAGELQPTSTPTPITALSVLRHPIVRLHILLFFIYTGLEVALGQWAFTVLTESRNIDPATAGTWVTIYWAGILAGRIGFGFIVDRIGIDRLIRYSLLTALLGTALLAWNPFPQSAALALALSGLGLAVIFPCLMTRTPQRLGPALAAHAIGFQVGAAMLGAAALPSACGLVAQHLGLHLVAPALLGIAVTLLLLHELLIFRTRNKT